jgi:nucleoside-diphosphate-sugar epimerase
MPVSLNIQSVSILGCGWYGLALARHLVKKGYHVKGSTTSTNRFSEFEDQGIIPFKAIFEADAELYDPEFLRCHSLIISIPPKRSAGEVDSYAPKVARIRAAVIKANVKKVIFVSSTSVYGDHNQHVDEGTEPNPDTASGKAVLQAEHILQDQSDFQLTILRFGGLFGPGRDPARFFSGKKAIPNGRAPVNMLHLDDCIGVTEAVIEKDAFGHMFNVCSDSHPEKKDFYTRAAQTSGMEPPEFIPERKDWKIVSSVNMKNILNYQVREI